MKITCIIVDDELPARQGLRALLEEYPDIEVVETCSNGAEAIDAIRSLRPHFVLLDVQMPHVNGFEVLTHIPPPRPQVIFITAHDEFALKAFEVNAVDYLLKPFNDERFEEAIARVREKIHRSPEDDRLSRLIDFASNRGVGSQAPPAEESRLSLRVDGEIHLVPHSEILFVEAYDYYVKVHLDGKYLLTRDTMRNMEEALPEDSFMRIHKSYLVNLRWVSVLTKEGLYDHVLQLTTGQQLKISRSKLSAVRERIANLR